MVAHLMRFVYSHDDDSENVNGDSETFPLFLRESIHLVVTSPPYWKLKRYNEHPDQMGHIQDYEIPFELDKVWRMSTGCWYRVAVWYALLAMSASPGAKTASCGLSAARGYLCHVSATWASTT